MGAGNGRVNCVTGPLQHKLPFSDQLQFNVWARAVSWESSSMVFSQERTLLEPCSAPDKLNYTHSSLRGLATLQSCFPPASIQALIQALTCECCCRQHEGHGAYSPHCGRTDLAWLASRLDHLSCRRISTPEGLQQRLPRALGPGMVDSLVSVRDHLPGGSHAGALAQVL